MATMNRKRQDPTGPIWKVRSLHHNFQWSGPLVAYWEVHLDPISDEYTPAEISAIDLLSLWARKVRESHPDELIPIYWSVDSPGQAKFERMPFQYHLRSLDGSPVEDFLSFYSWPVNAKSGEPLNWVTLPVADKAWNSKRADKGGFIQEATGWETSGPAALRLSSSPSLDQEMTYSVGIFRPIACTYSPINPDNRHSLRGRR